MCVSTVKPCSILIDHNSMLCARQVNIEVHFALKHSNECQVYRCSRCSTVFHSEMEWHLHVRVHHLGVARPFRCPDRQLADFLYSLSTVLLMRLSLFSYASNSAGEMHTVKKLLLNRLG